MDLLGERKKQLTRISAIRQRDVLVYAADSSKAKQGAAVAIENSDLLPITDQVANLGGTGIDVILETGGGSGETAEDIVRLLYEKYQSVAFIVPGMAKSAGTIMAMAGDEILMEPASSLGPIDAQIQRDGKVFSAEALLRGLDRIKEEVATTNTLNRAYVPILQGISPGEIQHAENALSFAQVLVTNWLKTHKFQNWHTHRTTNPGTPVTEAQKEQRASEIAGELCDHSKWLSHGRSIKMADLKGIGLEITDYTQIPDLADAIRRYHVLLQISFERLGVYKLFETPKSQIQRLLAQNPFAPRPIPMQAPVPPLGASAGLVPAGMMVDVQCNRCNKSTRLQADFDVEKPLQSGTKRFPKDNVLVCDGCQSKVNVEALRKQLEAQMKRSIV